MRTVRRDSGEAGSVETTPDGALSAGPHQMSWDGRGDDGQSVRTGLYFVGLEADGRSLGARRLVVQRRRHAKPETAAAFRAKAAAAFCGVARWCSNL